jgi:hypothetical protein
MASSEPSASRSKRSAIRVRAAKRLTAVGRVAASSRRATPKRSRTGAGAPLRRENAAP